MSNRPSKEFITPVGIKNRQDKQAHAHRINAIDCLQRALELNQNEDINKYLLTALSEVKKL